MGVKNIMFGGEGLFINKHTNQGKMYMQTLHIAEFTGRIAKGLPSPNEGKNVKTCLKPLVYL